MNDLTTIRTRWAEHLWNQKPTDGENAQKYYDSLIPAEDGTLYWEDVLYDDQDRAGWKTMFHLYRIKTILLANGRDRLTADAAYARRMTDALRHWTQRSFINPNWWFNDIGAPRELSDITLMMMPVLDAESLAGAADWVTHGSLITHPERSERWTGANLIWGVINTVKHALITDDENALRTAVERGAREICIGEKEGIQTDGSFFQHGPRLYSGGYGRSFAADIANLSYFLQGTKFQLSPENLDIYITHILDGLYHMSHGGSLDYACIGRELSRPDAVRMGSLMNTLRMILANGDMPRRDEVQVYLDASLGGDRPDSVKYFPIPAFLTWHCGGIYVGAKFLTNKIWGAEICNNEGELCYNMTYGTHTCVMHTGGEYVNIMSVWDYARIPGTTSRTETDEEILAHRDWTKNPLPNGHSGGMQKGKRAVIYELAQHDGVEATVSDFAFEDGYVRLGAGIRVTDGREEALVTTVDQCVVQGEIHAGSRSVIHGGVRYTALGDTEMETAYGVRTGSWSRGSLTLPYEEVKKNVLTVTVSHPCGGESTYAYMISPACKAAPAVEILANTPALQAIRLADGSVMAVFHKRGTLKAGDREITGDGICIE
ncbi:MAG: hypothetical protein E7662_06460 [Ruminococcaceae bacterium]|nr:hypothetical protein [Oscillospiraceae bacterium]